MSLISITSNQAKTLISEHFTDSEQIRLTAFQYYRKMLMGEAREFSLPTGAKILIYTERTGQGGVRRSSVKWYLLGYSEDNSDIQPYLEDYSRSSQRERILV